MGRTLLILAISLLAACGHKDSTPSTTNVAADPQPTASQYACAFEYSEQKTVCTPFEAESCTVHTYQVYSCMNLKTGQICKVEDGGNLLINPCSDLAWPDNKP